MYYAGAFKGTGGGWKDGGRDQDANMWADQIQPAHLYDLGRLFKYHNHPFESRIYVSVYTSLHDHTARSCDRCLLALRSIARITR